MKVGTDGVLLGAWSRVDGCVNVLDVGTGTGLIALMIAQRNINVHVDAIDLDKGSVIQAQHNVANSPFSHRIDVQQKPFQDFVQETDKKYDLIISNPPYFQNSLKSPFLTRSYARHNDSLSFYEIISEGASLLTERGCISLILPHEFKQTILEHAKSLNLHALRIANVFPVYHKPAKRLLIEFARHETLSIEQDMVIERSRHQYTDEFKALTIDFYLDK